jgi:hypothetical protein
MTPATAGDQTMTLTTLANHELVTDEIHNFDGLRDRFDRQIGVTAYIRCEEWAVSEEQRWGYSIEPGVWFYVAVHQVRNNETYGSGYTNFRFKTLEEAQQKAEELVAKRRKEYTKKYGQQ